MVHCLVDHDFWSFVLLLLGYIGWCQEGDWCAFLLEGTHTTHKYHHLAGSSLLPYVDNLVGLEYLNIYTCCTMIFLGVIYIHDCNSLWGSTKLILYLRKKLCLIIHLIGLVVFLDYISVQIQNQYAIVLCTECLLLCLSKTRDGRWSHGFNMICVND